jgi:hypothetical protein
MLGQILLTNKLGFTPGIDINAVTNGAGISVRSFETSIELRGSERPKVAQEGNYDEYTYAGKRLITFEGDILGTTAADYWTRRLAFVKEITHQYTFSKNPVLALQMDMAPSFLAEDLNADCRVESWLESPLGLAGATLSTYRLTLKSNFPYFRGGSNSQTVTPGAGAVALSALAGNAPNPPVLTITGPITNPVISLQGGTAFNFNGVSLTAGQTIVVDVLKRTMTHSGGTNLYAVIGVPFWEQNGYLQPNYTNKNMQLTGTGTTGATQLQIQYYNSYNL